MSDQASILRSLLAESAAPSDRAASPTSSRASIGPAPADRVDSERRGRVSFGPTTQRPAPRIESPRLARAIAIASGKGGVGKSNLALNLSIELARLGRRVALFDADLGCANADVLCGLPVKSTLADVVNGRRRLSEIMVRVPGIRGRGGVGLVPGASGVTEVATLHATQRQLLVEQLVALEKVVDLVLIDVGAGIAADAVGFASAADSVLLTCTPEPTAMTDAYAAAVHTRMDTVARRHLGRSLPLAGIVPFDFSVVGAVKRRKPLALLAPDARATVAIRTIARSLVEDRPGGERSTPRRGFLAGLLRTFARD
jgi:flagellar biosynthesis protein FlhG